MENLTRQEFEFTATFEPIPENVKTFTVKLIVDYKINTFQIVFPETSNEIALLPGYVIIIQKLLDEVHKKGVIETGKLDARWNWAKGFEI